METKNTITYEIECVKKEIGFVFTQTVHIDAKTRNEAVHKFEKSYGKLGYEILTDKDGFNKISVLETY